VSSSSAAADLPALRVRLRACLADLQQVARLASGSVLVVGASSSEIVGERIGTQTSMEVGRAVVEEVLAFVDGVGCEVAFQCCEHLNRALVVSAAVAAKRQWQRVMALPVPGAGGAVAASAHTLLADACLVEAIQADAGIDIGDTLIGMHLKRVAVPVRGRYKQVGAAHLTMATTRPPLIGGARAVYERSVYQERLGKTERGNRDDAVTRLGQGDCGSDGAGTPSATRQT